MAQVGRGRDDRAQRERARVYDARQRFHARQSRRRTRDNIVAGVVGGVIVLAAGAAQLGYFTAGPGMPVPEPTETVAPVPTPTESSTPSPAQTTPPPTP